MRSNKKSFLQLQLAFVIYSLTSIISKKASEFKLLSVAFVVLYLLELLVMFVYAFIWQKILKKYDLVIAYSCKGITIIWTMIWAILLFKESITINNIVGAMIVIIGIVVISYDS